MTRISVSVDGVQYTDDVEPRTLLVHYLRERLGKVGTVVGCDTSNCGACTVLMSRTQAAVDGRQGNGQSPDGQPTNRGQSTNGQATNGQATNDKHGVKSCSVLAVQADGREITTIEGLADATGTLHPVQKAFHEQHALQCGFCTPGMIMAAVDLLADNANPTDEQVREGLEGNLCRCTGYQNIVRAVQSAARSAGTTS